MTNLMLKSKKLFLFFFMVLFIQSCGYSLKQNVSSFENKIISVVADSSELNRLFTEEIKSISKILNTNQTSIKSDADIIIYVKNHKISKYSAAQGKGGRTREIRLDYLLELKIKFPGTEKIVDEKITDVKYMAFSDSNILGMESEEEEILREFIRLAVNRINIEF